jgi:chromatin remodeling complex protein RSC6
MATTTAKSSKAKSAEPAKAEAPAKAAAPAKSSASAKAEAPEKSAKKPNAGLAKPVQPSKELAVVVGEKPIPRTEVISKVWEYIRTHNLQNPANKREILADPTLHAVFGKDKVTMFEMNKLLSGHLK